MSTASPRTPRSRHLLVFAVLLAAAALAGWAAARVDTGIREDNRLTQLQVEARRKAIEVMSSTVNGNLMGAITLLGLTDMELKREARRPGFVATPSLEAELRTLGRAFGANGVFLVGTDGVIRSSWDWGANPSTGLDVKFRPYFKMAMAGKTSVYAAISVSQGERSLYFAAPLSDLGATGATGATPAIGAVVARTDLARVDALLQGEVAQALLLSPQQVVFASKQIDWVGSLAAEPSLARLTAIRELRQFGTLFDDREPRVLPLSVQGGIQAGGSRRYAVASAEVNWNDPAGPWTLVLMEDLAATVPASRSLTLGALVAALVLLLGWMAYRLWHARQKQQRANGQLRQFAALQEANAAFRAELSQLAAKLQRCEQLPELASIFLPAARDMLGAPQGAVYVASRDATPHLLLLGAAAAGEAVPKRLALGQELMGQCALDRRRLVLVTPPPGPWRLRSGLGNAMPGALVLAPLVLHEELVGVVELALLQPPDDVQQGRLDDLLSLLSNSLEILRRSPSAWQALSEDRQEKEPALEVDA